jgi:deazaflavin-dependent oxidoreductase (nitroreductase family)
MGTEMHIPRFMRQVNRVVTNPVMSTFAWLVPPFAIIHHVGRKSGRRYSTPVVAFRSAGGFVVPMTYGRDVDWGRNLVAAGGGEVEQLGHRTRTKNPRIVAFPAVAADIPLVMRPVLRAADFPGYLRLDV